MPGTFPILELRQTGEVEEARVKQSDAKPTLKDIQSHLKKKVLPAVIATYAYGARSISMIGYVKGKETELSQHQLPPPCEVGEVYGTIVLVSHENKTEWNASTAGIEGFSAADYEIFYEKACSGELEAADADADADAEQDDEDDVDVDADADQDAADAEEDDVDAEQEEGDEADGDAEQEEAVDVAEDEEAEVLPRARVSRKAIKPDVLQVQFQFKTELALQETPDAATVNSQTQRKQVYDVLKATLSEHCSDEDILDLEMGIFNASLEEATRRMVPLTWKHETFQWIYKMVTRRTAANFDPNSYVANKRLIERWKEGEFTLDAIGSWSAYDLQPAYWKDLKDQQLRREQRILEGNLSMATDRFRCSGCKKKMCSYYELQTRSADEPMTIFIRCLNCGKQWKQ